MRRCWARNRCDSRARLGGSPDAKTFLSTDYGVIMLNQNPKLSINERNKQSFQVKVRHDIQVTLNDGILALFYEYGVIHEDQYPQRKAAS